MPAVKPPFDTYIAANFGTDRGTVCSAIIQSHFSVGTTIVTALLSAYIHTNLRAFFATHQQSISSHD